MNDKDKIAELESVIARFLAPIRGVPFPVIVKSLSGGASVIQTDKTVDASLIEALIATAHDCAKVVSCNPIVRNRPNEVGNDVEPFVRRCAMDNGLRVERPVSRNGISKTTGYPDLLVHDEASGPAYIECKTYAYGTSLTSMRSFYLSPSDEFKVCVDARHILMAFGVVRRQIPGSINSAYTLSSFKLVDLYNLSCDVKYEFNSDNRRLYGSDMILAEGDLQA